MGFAIALLVLLGFIGLQILELYRIRDTRVAD
jgi:hypothetical protein